MPVIVYVMLFGHYAAAFWIFVVAAATDALDGAIAKQFSVESEVGAFLDPLADKALLLGVYVLLGYTGHIAAWLVILIVFRDILIIAGAIMFHTITHSLKMKPLLVSKVNTLAQFLLASLVLAELGLEFDLAGVADLLVYVVAATTFISGAAYVTKWGILAATMEREP